MAQAGSNDEKNWGSKISLDCPFKERVICVKNNDNHWLKHHFACLLTVWWWFVVRTGRAAVILLCVWPTLTTWTSTSASASQRWSPTGTKRCCSSPVDLEMFSVLIFQESSNAGYVSCEPDLIQSSMFFSVLRSRICQDPN